ncbi:MAG TPA: VOC family protein [Gillisia sp.]|nr:VOC family protein [Gillisia sp.]
MIIILFSSFGTAQSNFSIKKDHDALQVKDLKASAKFYGEVMGLPEIPNGGLGDHIRWFQLDNKIQIHLIESEEEVTHYKGFHTALNIDDLSKFMEHLRSKNIHFENWEGDPDTTNTRPDGVKQIYFQDPDGYWIEVNDGSL